MKEVLFAQRLADNDKKMRDRALKKLRKYLSIKSSGGAAIPKEDALKLWKGLFYCMYMADKPLIQEAVAEDICGLIHHINNEEDCRSFVKASFLTFAREWNGIDVFRIDKFMMFVRRFLRHVFIHLRAGDWKPKDVMTYASILETTVVCPNDNANSIPLGLKTHVCEIILEELAKIGGEDLQHSVVMAFVQPYFKVLALTKINAYIRYIAEAIIHHLIRQTLHAEEEEDEVQEEADDSVLEQEGTTGDEAESEERMEEDLDPRAAKVDTFLPQLKVDLNLMADSLQKVGAVSRVLTKNREVIYRLVCELRDAAQGHDPLALPRDHVDQVEVPESEVEKAVERLEKFEEDLGAGRDVANEDSDDDSEPVKKRQFKSKYEKRKYLRLKKKRKQLSKGLSKAKKRKLDGKLKELAQKRTKAVENMVKQITVAAGVPRSSIVKPTQQIDSKNGFEISPISQMKRSKSAPKPVSNSFTVEKTPEVKKKRKNKGSTKKGSKRKCFDVSALELQSNRMTESSIGQTNASVPSVVVTKGKENDKISALDLQSNGKEKTSVVKENGNVVNSVTGERSTEKKNSQMANKIHNADGRNSIHLPVDNKTVIKPVHKKTVIEPVQNKTAIKPVHKKTVKKTVLDKTAIEPVHKKTPPDTKIEVAVSTSPSISKGLVLNFSKMKKQKGVSCETSPKKKSAWDESLKEGEYEYEVVIRNKKKPRKIKERKVSSIKKRLTAGIPKQRKISINLKKNKEHEFSDYVRTLRASPCIPFKADLAPKAPVLKPSPSPILVRGSIAHKKLQKKVAVSASPQLSLKKRRQTAADFF